MLYCSTRMDTSSQRALTPDIDGLTSALLASYGREGGINHLDGCTLPSRDAIIDIVRMIESLLFPGFYRAEDLNAANIRYITGSRLVSLHARLTEESYRNILFELGGPGNEAEARSQALAVAEYFLHALPAIRALLSTDVNALLEGDPAARSREEIILSYPGMRAIAIHRVAHFLWQHGVHLIARMMSEYIHSRTGIDIHPGASIGRYFYIDHGTGVVIGETTVIGENVKIYQGVSLGALSVDKNQAERKRHPSIEDRVTIYAGATILGGHTVIGHDSVIGGNVWLVRSVPPHSLVINEPSIAVRSADEASRWMYEI
jgi:serine O-acetyltransferase